MVEGRTYKPVIEPERCQPAMFALRGCPAELIPEYRKEEKSLRGTLYSGKIKERSSKEQDPSPSLPGGLSHSSGYKGLCGSDCKREDERGLGADSGGQSLACGLWIHLPSSL